MDKFAFLFPGQGTQFIKMGKTFYDNYLIARQTFEEANSATGQDIIQLCFSGSFSQINQFTNMQLAIVTTEVAIFRAYMEDYGVPPQFLLGHSIGEYAALVCSGAIEFADCLKILQKRGELVQKILAQSKGSMTIIEQVSEEQVHAGLKAAGTAGKVSLSCYNSPSQFAVCGEKYGLEIFEDEMVKRNAVITPLLQSPPMHSRMMEEIREEFKEFLDTFCYHPFQYPIISNVTGKAMTDARQIPYMLSEHLIRPVQFTRSVEYMLNFGVNVVIEMSPKLLLTLFINSITAEVSAFCYGLEKNREQLHVYFQQNAGYEKDMPDFLGACLCELASTRNNNPDNDNQRVAEIYNTIKKEYMSTETTRFTPSDSHFAQILKLVIEALKIKYVPENEIADSIRSILHRTNKMYVHSDFINQGKVS